MTSAAQSADQMPAPGSVLVIRDEEWLVTKAERATDGGWFVDVQGISELVRDTGNDNDENNQRDEQELAHGAQYTGSSQQNRRSDIGLSGSGEFD